MCLCVYVVYIPPQSCIECDGGDGGGAARSGRVCGVAQVATDGGLLPWSASAIAAGLAFGALYAATGELVGVVVAHILINYENLHFVRSYDPSRRVPRTPSAPGLVGDRLRVGGHS